MDDNQMTAMLEQDEEMWYSMLIDRYTSYVTAVVGGIAKGALTAADIEETSADVFYKIWCRRRQIRAGSMKALIAQTARNATIDRLRVKGMEFVPYDDDILQISGRERPDDLAIVREQKQIVEEAVRRFGEPDREIFIRYYYFGETLKTIADRLELNSATAKTKLRRSRLKLVEIMKERGYGCEQE